MVLSNLKKALILGLLLTLPWPVEATLFPLNVATLTAIPTPAEGTEAVVTGTGQRYDYTHNGWQWIAYQAGTFNTNTPTATVTPTITSTVTPTNTPTNTLIVINTPVNTNTPWNTFTFTNTFTNTATPTGTLTPTPTPGIQTATSASNYCGNPHLILAGLDSLTLSEYSDYLDFLITMMKSKYGDGGPGLFPLDNNHTAYWGFSYSYDASGAQIGSFNTVPAMYGIGAYAVSWQGASNGWFTAQPTPAVSRYIGGYTNQPIYPQTYDYARLFYLQQPGGGTFTFNTAGSLASNAINVNTNGVLKIGYVELPGNPANVAVSVTSIVGNLCLYAVEFYNKTGVMVNCIGSPGTDIYSQWQFLNPATQTQWFALLRPDFFLLNEMRNDASNNVDPGIWQLCFKEYMRRIHAGWPNCNILQIVPNRAYASDTYVDNPQGYKDLAVSNWINGIAGVIDNAVAMGTYNQSLTWVEMTVASNPHPNYQGSRLIADNIFKKINASLEYSSWGAQQYEYTASGDLFKHTFGFPITVTQAQKVLEFGLASGAQQSVQVHLVVSGNLDGTVVANKTSVDIFAQNSFALSGCVSAFTTGNPVTIFQANDSSGGALNYVFTYDVNSSNRMEVWMTPSTTSALSSTHFCKISITGDWTTLSNFTGSVAYATPTPGIQGPTFFQVY